MGFHKKIVVVSINKDRRNPQGKGIPYLWVSQMKRLIVTIIMRTYRRVSWQKRHMING